MWDWTRFLNKCTLFALPSVRSLDLSPTSGRGNFGIILFNLYSPFARLSQWIGKVHLIWSSTTKRTCMTYSWSLTTLESDEPWMTPTPCWMSASTTLPLTCMDSMVAQGTASTPRWTNLRICSSTASRLHQLQDGDQVHVLLTPLPEQVHTGLDVITIAKMMLCLLNEAMPSTPHTWLLTVRTRSSRTTCSWVPKTPTFPWRRMMPPVREQMPKRKRSHDTSPRISLTCTVSKWSSSQPELQLARMQLTGTWGAQEEEAQAKNTTRCNAWPMHPTLLSKNIMKSVKQTHLLNVKCNVKFDIVKTEKSALASSSS